MTTTIPRKPHRRGERMTAIRHILTWGTGEWHTVLLACGHRFRLRRAQLQTEQLYEGKPVTCAECAQPGKVHP